MPLQYNDHLSIESIQSDLIHVRIRARFSPKKEIKRIASYTQYHQAIVTKSKQVFVCIGQIADFHSKTEVSLVTSCSRK